MTKDTKQAQHAGGSVAIEILTVLGVLILGGLIYLLIGGIFSGIGVPLWVSGIIAALILVPLAAGCAVKWDKLYSVYRSGGMETLRLSKWERHIYSLMRIVLGIPTFFKNLGLTVWNAVKSAGKAVAAEAKDIWSTFVHGDWKTKVSYLVMGFG